MNSSKLSYGLSLALVLVSRALTMSKHSVPQYLECCCSSGCGHRIAYHSVEGTTRRKKDFPGVVYCNGFRSDMSGRKAMALERHCRKVNRAFVRFDYRGHGESSGNFLNLTLTDWIDDTLNVVDNLTNGPQILVGSSMGAWIAIHVAFQRPDRVASIIGIAAAPDFTRQLWNDLSVEAKQVLQDTGVYYTPSVYSDEPYPITMKLLNDAQKWFLLSSAEEAKVRLSCPVHLFHGLKDDDVPWRQSMALFERFMSTNVAVTLVKNGDHRLSESDDLLRILWALEAIAHPFISDQEDEQLEIVTECKFTSSGRKMEEQPRTED